MNKVTTIAIIQARMQSTRLPGKAMVEIAGKPAVQMTLERVARSRVDAVWLACSQAPADDPLAAFAADLGFAVFRGDEDDVLGRFAVLARQSGASVLVRITGDCPLVDPAVIDLALARFAQGDVDYVSNGQQRTYPDGLDVEVFSRAALDEADAKASHPFLRLHVTPYIHGRLKDRFPCGDFRRAQIVNPVDYSHLRWTLDEPEDLDFLNRLVPLLPQDFGWEDALRALTLKPELMRLNRRHGLNEGTERDLRRLGAEGGRVYDVSNALLERALKTVPLGSQTFSKSHQQVPRGAAPLFFDHGSGCRVWDVDGNGYIDYILGLMPLVLGYRDPDVDAAITAQMDKGITFSLPSTLEMELAERLVRLIPCAEMVRFGKNGSDVTTAAIRLARAHTGRDRVVICGYHGWHDWYIGTTTRNLGVPKDVQKLSTTVPFNDLDALEKLLAADGDSFACLIMEPTGKAPPAAGYLERIRELTAKHGIVLVFDEIITGFRMSLGGAQSYYGVTPDLATFGKAMGNGMPISAVVGRADIMRKMEDIFFSGTFGGEALSLAAAIATIDKLERLDVTGRLWRRGAVLTEGMNKVITANGLGDLLKFEGESWWPRMSIAKPPIDGNLLASLLRQEFINNGLFLTVSLNLCLAHDSDAVTAETTAAANGAMANLRTALDSADPARFLRGEQIRPTFSVR